MISQENPRSGARIRERCLASCAAVLVCCHLAGCATMPSEAITLSQAVGNDIEQLYAGYRASVRASFDGMRDAGLAVIDNRWAPAYLASFAQNGKLAEFAAVGNTEAVEFWAQTAIQTIDAKRREFLDPLNAREAALLTQIDAAFSRTINANATVTGFIKSAVSVKDMQDQVLQSAGVLDISNQINAEIVNLSNFVAAETKKIVDATAVLEKSTNNTE